MKSQKVLQNELRELTKLTRQGRQNWEVIVSTTEYNDSQEKPTVNEDGVTWEVDECYVSYHTTYKGEEFLLISYEMLHKSENQQRSTNLIFLPPLGIRYFDIHTLLPYSIEADQILAYEVHQLWETILSEKKKGSSMISLDVSPRQLTIE